MNNGSTGGHKRLDHLVFLSLRLTLIFLSNRSPILRSLLAASLIGSCSSRSFSVVGLFCTFPGARIRVSASLAPLHLHEPP
jgi:hypothetical protein